MQFTANRSRPEWLSSSQPLKNTSSWVSAISCRRFLQARHRLIKKNLFLVALKFFRTLISLQDTFYQALMTHNNTFGLILDIVYETMPRDNLLNSACLELFEFIKRENIKPFILHVVEKYREKLENITYVDTFQNLILRYDQMQGYGAEADSTLFSQDDSTPRRMPLNGQRWQGVKELDAAEEEYFNTSDDEDEVSPVATNNPGHFAHFWHSGPKRIAPHWLLAWPMDRLLQLSSRWSITLTMTMKMLWTPNLNNLQKLNH